VQEFFLGQMDYVFFVYGLAFFLLGASALTLRADAFPQLPWGWLAAFALSHGASEWLDLAVLSIGRSQALLTVKTLVMATSFVFLLEFARRSLHKAHPRSALGFGLTIGLLSLVIAAGVWGGLLWLDIAARYLLGLIGGLLASAAIYRTIATSRAGTRPWLLALATLTIVYALLAGAITPGADLFPAQTLNYDRFLEWSGGIPVQVPRALTAVGMAAAMWLGSQLPAAKARSEDLPFHYALGLAGAILVLVPSGWGITETLGRQSLRETEQHGIHQARSASLLIDQQIERLAQAAHLLAVNDAVTELALHRDERQSREVNRVLDHVAIAFGLDAAYLLEPTGNVIAASNRNTPDSYLGQNYAFRPYFQAALNGSGASYAALGVTSVRIGHYASAPVLGPGGDVRLVAVLKSSLPSLASLPVESRAVMVLAPSGVVLDALDRNLALRSLWPLSDTENEALIESRQFGPGPFVPLLPTQPRTGQLIDWQGSNMLYIRAPLSLDGWSLALFMPIQDIRVHRLFGIAATMMSSLLAIGFYIVLHGHEVYELRVGTLMAQLRDQAHTDPLTRLANRGWFQENFERERRKADRVGSSLALTMFDIDHFKAINDRHGHQAGDQVLLALAERMRGLMRDYDIISRWGGEEFIVLLPDTDLDGACRIAERLRAEIAAMGIPEVGQVTCSFGVAERRGGESMDSLINRADAALYQAKDAGRDRVVSA
jgi:diguanylate cyclase (GGDEF)-like protein